MLRKLKLYGELAEFVGHKEFEIQVDSLGKAVSFLVNLISIVFGFKYQAYFINTFLLAVLLFSISIIYFFFSYN